jgi:hypothetical protein
MIPRVPTDNLYKFCAIAGIILCVATDRKSRTVTSTMTNAKGVKVTSTLAYDKS